MNSLLEFSKSIYDRCLALDLLKDFDFKDYNIIINSVKIFENVIELY